MTYAKVIFSSILYLAILSAFLILSTSGAGVPPGSLGLTDSEPGGINKLDLRDSALVGIPLDTRPDASDKPPATGQVTPDIPMVEIWYHIRDNAENGHTAVSGMVRLRRAIQGTAYGREKANFTEAANGPPLKAFFSSSRPLLYVKLCGYSNIGNYFAFATLLLVSWLILEIVYYIAGSNQTLDLPDSSPTITPERRVPSEDAFWFTAAVCAGIFVLMIVVNASMVVLGKGDSLFEEVVIASFAVESLSLAVFQGCFNLRGLVYAMLVFTLITQTWFYVRLFSHQDLSLSKKSSWTEMLP
ncbi:uncharacterized protein H6S33_007117 [Morchella sextelata]|uniref:uncharacterized protein n=1 Tax=Morchella sextelata TaxID=1174677 RepID=UPI001D057AF3|nr:uncharacterized protein H6S33_007117 [Morchella sextelata]KAH0604086.1 hypothetical protein H6S33_007117 [Morchella sextelata]